MANRLITLEKHNIIQDFWDQGKSGKEVAQERQLHKATVNTIVYSFIYLPDGGY